MKRSAVGVATLLVAGALLAGCGNVLTTPDAANPLDTTGSLVIRISTAVSANTIQPPLDMTIASYVVTLSGPTGSVSQTIPAGQTSAAFDSLAVGEWSATVNARNANDPPVIIATGTAPATVTGGATTSVGVNVVPVNGEGTLDLTITWPVGVVADPNIVSTLTPVAGTTQEISASFAVTTGVDTQTASYSGSWPDGYYSLTLSLTDGGVQVWGDMVGVRIIAGETSIGRYTLAESELNPLEQVGAVEVNVGIDLQNPYTIALAGQVAELGPTEDMIVTASLSPSDPPDSYEWYLNGHLVPSQETDSITIGPSGVWVADDTPYRLTLVVRSGVTISSQTVSFLVTPNVDTPPATLPVVDASPNDEYYGLQWHYDAIGMPGAWGFITDASHGPSFAEVVVAVIDTGYLAHEDLVSNVTTDGYDFISDPTRANDGDGIDPDPTDAGNDPTSPNYHGTHVSGTIAALTNNATGVSGVGWDRVRVMPLRVLGVGGALNSDIVQAIHYASGEPNDSGTTPASVVSVINMSLGGSSYSQSMYDAIQTAVSKGITVVASAGNDGVLTTRYPAGYSNTVAVSATVPLNALAEYSNYGPTVEFAAPGGGQTADTSILSTYGPSGYQYMSGTSMAAPHVAGVAALLYSYDGAMSQAAVRSVLATTARDLGATGRDDMFGYGLVQADQALAWLVENGVPLQPSGQLATTQLTDDEVQRRVFSEMERGGPWAEDRVIVKLRSPEYGVMSSSRSAETARNLAARHALPALTGAHPLVKTARVPPGRTVREVVSELAADDAVEYAEPDYVLFPTM